MKSRVRHSEANSIQRVIQVAFGPAPPRHHCSSVLMHHATLSHAREVDPILRSSPLRSFGSLQVYKTEAHTDSPEGAAHDFAAAQFSGSHRTHLSSSRIHHQTYARRRLVSPNALL